MGRASRAFNNLHSSANRVRAGMAGMSSGAMRVGMASMALTVPLALGARSAIKFDDTMAGVKAITQASAVEMGRLSETAEDLALATVFSASQVGSAMETMSRAGFSTTETLEGVRAVLDTAAAEGIQMAEAAKIVTQNLRAFGKTSSEAGIVADILARASSRANTNIVGLGEGLKYAAPIARTMGVTLEETVSVLSMLADTGLEGSLAGTTLKNALIKMAKPSTEGAKVMKKLGLTVRDAKGDFLGMSAVLKQLATGMNVYGGRVDRAAAAAELFGLRGIALTNLLNRLDTATAGGAKTFDEFLEMLKESSGAAAEMATTRLDTLGGKLKLIGSSLEVFWINVMKPFLDPLKDAVQGGIDQFNLLIQAMRWVQKPFEDLSKLTVEQRKMFEQMTPSIWGVARGIMDALGTVKQTVKDMIGWFKQMWEKIGGEKLSGDAIRKITKIVALVALVGAAAGPVLLALTGIGFAISGLTTLIGGIITVVSGVVGIVTSLFGIISAIGIGGLAAIFGPLLAVLAVLAVLFFALRKEGESFTDTISRLAGVVKGAVIDPIIKGVRGFVSILVQQVKSIVGVIKEQAVGIFARLKSMFAKLGDLFVRLKPIIGIIGTVLGFIGEKLLWLGNKLLPIIGAYFRTTFRIIGTAVKVAIKTVEILITVISATIFVVTALVNWIGNKAIPKIKEWGTSFKKWLQPGIKWLKTAIGDIEQFFTKIGNAITDKVQEWGTSFKKWLQPGIDWLGTAIGNIKTLFVGIGNAIWEHVQLPVRAMALTFAKLLDWASGVGKILGIDVTGTVAGLRAFAAGAGVGEAARIGAAAAAAGEFVGPLLSEAGPGPGLAKTVAEEAADGKAFAAGAAAQEERCIEVKSEVDIEVPVNIDGREVAHAQAKYHGEVRDRTGAKTTPWQQRQLVVNATSSPAMI